VRTKGGPHVSHAYPTHPSDVITLSETARSRLQTFVHREQERARRRTRAQVWLKLGAGWSLEAVCAAFDVCRNTAVRVRRRFQEGGVEAVLTDQRQGR
jgi:transposase